MLSEWKTVNINELMCYVLQVYVSMPALSMHILTHDLKYRCTVCEKSFSRPWLLQGHLRSHTGEKPFGCAHCGKAFADRSNLRAHMQTHSAFKLYACKRCGKSFALKAYLNKHHESACLRDDENECNSTDMHHDLNNECMSRSPGGGSGHAMMDDDDDDDENCTRSSVTSIWSVWLSLSSIYRVVTLWIMFCLFCSQFVIVYYNVLLIFIMCVYNITFYHLSYSFSFKLHIMEISKQASQAVINLWDSFFHRNVYLYVRVNRMSTLKACRLGTLPSSGWF